MESSSPDAHEPRGPQERFIELVREERLRRGWSISELARRAGSSQSNVSTYLNYGREDMTAEFVMMIADAYGWPRVDALRTAGFLPAPGKEDRLAELSSQLDDDLLQHFIEIMERCVRIGALGEEKKAVDIAPNASQEIVELERDVSLEWVLRAIQEEYPGIFQKIRERVQQDQTDVGNQAPESQT